MTPAESGLVRVAIERDGDRPDPGLRQCLRATCERLERGARSRARRANRTARSPASLSAPRAIASSRTDPAARSPARGTARTARCVGRWRRGRRHRRRRRSRARCERRRRLDAAAFDDAHAGVQRDVGEHLRAARGPVHGQLDDALARAKAEQQFLRVLRQEPGAGLHDLRLPQPIGLDGDPRADRVAVALRADETDARAAAACGERSKSFRNTRSCGACRAAITTRSGSPSRSTSSTANDRPS